MTTTRRPRRLSAQRWRLLVLPAAALLLLFHAALLWQRVADQSLLQPEVGLRWALSLGAVLLAVRLRKSGLSLLSGRPATALWVALLLIHAGGVPLAGDPGAADSAAPLALPLFLGGVAGFALALMGPGTALASGPYRLRLRRLLGCEADTAPWRGFGSRQLSRPPPA